MNNNVRTWVRLYSHDQRFLCTLGIACILLALFSFWIARSQDFATRNPYMSDDIALKTGIRN
jgi:hypothetical protein